MTLAGEIDRVQQALERLERTSESLRLAGYEVAAQELKAIIAAKRASLNAAWQRACSAALVPPLA